MNDRRTYDRDKSVCCNIANKLGLSERDMYNAINADEHIEIRAKRVVARVKDFKVIMGLKACDIIHAKNGKVIIFSILKRDDNQIIYHVGLMGEEFTWKEIVELVRKDVIESAFEPDSFRMFTGPLDQEDETQMGALKLVALLSEGNMEKVVENLE